jgi:hypothetical protein
MIFRFLLKALKKPMQTIAFVRFFIFRPNTYILSTMHQSGTHWLQVLLANILSKNFNLENVSDIHAKNIIPYYPHSFLYDKDYSVPKILHSHHNRNLFFFNKPTILLVRDIRDSLVSQYEKYNKANKTDISFSIFLRKESEDLVAGWQTFPSRVEFLNSWSGQNVLIVRYEDLKNDLIRELKRITSHIDIDINKDILDFAIEESSFKKMKKMQANESETRFAINKGVVGRYKEYFSNEDMIYFQKYIIDNLQDSYGYNYEKW